MAREVCSGGRSRTANHLLVLGLKATFRQHPLRTTSAPSGTCCCFAASNINPYQHSCFILTKGSADLSTMQFGEDHIVPSDQQRRRRPGEEQLTSQHRKQPGGAVLQPSGEQRRPQPSPAPNTVAFTFTHPHLCASTPQERHGNSRNKQAQAVQEPENNVNNQPTASPPGVCQQATSEAGQGFGGLQSGRFRAARLLQG